MFLYGIFLEWYLVTCHGCVTEVGLHLEENVIENVKIGPENCWFG